MRANTFLTSSFGLVALIFSANFGVAVADPVAEPAPARYQPAPSCTTSWYPAFVTDTSKQRAPVYLQVRASNPAIDGRNVVLRPDDKVKGVQRVVVDDKLTSPVLALQMRKGALYSEARDFSNNLNDLGPVGGFRNITYNAATLTGKAEFIFRNLTRSSPPDFKRSVKLFELVGGGDTSEYGLYSTVPNLVVNGFIACKQRDSKGSYWQMIYYVNGGSTTEDPKGCEYIGLNVILAPSLIPS
ncbi:hypothetical protein H072_5266 [Dactylellina haptotyla CBS 200.50]|uniref:Ubiquitin 3 binding protein But2 C-terminal domain-containing protein n=1 Tax=Dactylellina haptotyla (strain CBS 200.50) TaxID=1284197 RepID=S8AIB4_DACHA|nr:hypothetical protein H072_5266 [Dactylellina haptotyla CBS 200.50]